MYYRICDHVTVINETGENDIYRKFKYQFDNLLTADEIPTCDEDFEKLYYYQLRYFSNAHDSKLESILADVNLKLQGERKEYKSHVIQKLKSKRLPEKDIR